MNGKARRGTTSAAVPRGQDDRCSVERGAKGRMIQRSRGIAARSRHRVNSSGRSHGGGFVEVRLTRKEIAKGRPGGGGQFEGSSWGLVWKNALGGRGKEAGRVKG